MIYCSYNFENSNGRPWCTQPNRLDCPKTAIRKSDWSVEYISSIAKILFVSKQILIVKIASDFEPPPPRRKISARQRAGFGFIFGEFPFGFWAKFRRKPLGRASRVPHVGFKKAVEFVVGVPSRNRTCISTLEGSCFIH